MAGITTESVWQIIGQRFFACLAYVTPEGAPRTAGIMYVVHNRRLYISTRNDSWKARYIAKDPQVALTITIPKRIPFMPWIKIPDATISFHGEARVLACSQVDAALLHELLHGRETDPTVRDSLCVIEVTPKAFFATYGVGVTLMQMRDQTLARGRVPV